MIQLTEQVVSVDTSIWVDYLRNGEEDTYQDLDWLVRKNLAAVCEPVVAEVISGSKNEREYQFNKHMMRANIILETPDAIWESIADARYKLLRQGHYIHFMDLWIAYSAYYARTYLWTLDKDFEIIQKVIPFKFYGK